MKKSAEWMIHIRRSNFSHDDLIKMCQDMFEIESQLEHYQELINANDVREWLRENAEDNRAINWIPSVKSELPKYAIPGDAVIVEKDNAGWLCDDIHAVWVKFTGDRRECACKIET